MKKQYKENSIKNEKKDINDLTASKNSTVIKLLIANRANINKLDNPCRLILEHEDNVLHMPINIGGVNKEDDKGLSSTKSEHNDELPIGYGISEGSIVMKNNNGEESLITTLGKNNSGIIELIIHVMDSVKEGEGCENDIHQESLDRNIITNNDNSGLIGDNNDIHEGLE